MRHYLKPTVGRGTMYIQPDEVQDYHQLEACAVAPKSNDRIALSAEIEAIIEAVLARASSQRAAS